jgi:aspartyl protease family protein
VRSFIAFAAGSIATFLLANLSQQDDFSRSASAYAARAALDEGTPADRLRSQATLRADDGMFYVDAAAGRETVRLLVDTGASHLVLNRNDAQRLKARKLDSAGPSTLETAAGRIAVEWVVVDELTIQGHRLQHVKAAMSSQANGISLLGQNALAQFRSLQIDDDVLTLSR